MDPKRIVAQGYDHIAEQYSQWTSRNSTEQNDRTYYTSLLLERLPIGAHVLELGCGAGIPTTRTFAERFNVTGVDLSMRQVSLARKNVPNATFLQADMTTLDFQPASFDAIAAFYSIIHVPRSEHPQLLRPITSWLRPGGLFVASMGASSTETGFEQDWLGAPMFWSHFDSETNLRLVEEAGLNILSAMERTADEDGVPVTFLWIVAQKPMRE